MTASENLVAPSRQASLYLSSSTQTLFLTPELSTRTRRTCFSR